MSPRTEATYRLVGYSGAGVASVLAWLQSWSLGAIISSATGLIGLVVWGYSRIRLSKSADDNKVWSDRQKLEREERQASAEAELAIKEKALKIELRLKALAEKAEAKSLAAKNKLLTARVTELEHALNESQIEHAKHEQREADLSRMLENSQRLTLQLQTQLRGVQAQTESNARRIEAVEQSGPKADGDGAG